MPIQHYSLYLTSKQDTIIPLVASLVDIAPAAPHTAPMQIEKDYSDTAGHLADTHFAVLDIPAHTADRVGYMVCSVVVT